MMLDANTTARMIRATAERLQLRTQSKKEPLISILIAFEELAKSFDSITERARQTDVNDASLDRPSNR